MCRGSFRNATSEACEILFFHRIIDIITEVSFCCMAILTKPTGARISINCLLLCLPRLQCLEGELRVRGRIRYVVLRCTHEVTLRGSKNIICALWSQFKNQAAQTKRRGYNQGEVQCRQNEGRWLGKGGQEHFHTMCNPVDSGIHSYSGMQVGVHESLRKARRQKAR